MKAGLLEPPSSAEDVRWDEVVRAHDRRVFLYLLSIGVRCDRARELTQATWARLIEQHRSGRLERVELPGIALAQARFLALDEVRKQHAERERIVPLEPGQAARVPDEAASVEMRLIQQSEIQIALDVIAACPASTQRVVRLLYEDPSMGHSAAAERLGLSLQRVRQILCEVRKKLRTALEIDARRGGPRS